MKSIKVFGKKKSLIVVMTLSGICFFLGAVIIGAPNLRLVGANVDFDGNSMAIVEDVQTGKQDVFVLHSNVFGIGRVQDIRNGEVILRVADQEMVLKSKSGVSSGADEGLKQETENQADVYSVEEAMHQIQAAADHKGATYTP